MERPLPRIYEKCVMMRFSKIEDWLFKKPNGILDLRIPVWR